MTGAANGDLNLFRVSYESLSPLRLYMRRIHEVFKAGLVDSAEWSWLLNDP